MARLYFACVLGQSETNGVPDSARLKGHPWIDLGDSASPKRFLFELRQFRGVSAESPIPKTYD